MTTSAAWGALQQMCLPPATYLAVRTLSLHLSGSASRHVSAELPLGLSSVWLPCPSLSPLSVTLCPPTRAHVFSSQPTIQLLIHPFTPCLLSFPPCVLSLYLCPSGLSSVSRPVYLPSVCPPTNLYLLSFRLSVLSLYLSFYLHLFHNLSILYIYRLSVHPLISTPCPSARLFSLCICLSACVHPFYSLSITQYIWLLSVHPRLSLLSFPRSVLSLYLYLSIYLCPSVLLSVSHPVYLPSVCPSASLSLLSFPPSPSSPPSLKPIAEADEHPRAHERDTHTCLFLFGLVATGFLRALQDSRGI